MGRQMQHPDNFDTIEEPINSASEEVQRIMTRVLKLEKDRLYKRSLRNINDDVLTIVKEVIQ
jgi:hypothetical protein